MPQICIEKCTYIFSGRNGEKEKGKGHTFSRGVKGEKRRLRFSTTNSAAQFAVMALLWPVKKGRIYWLGARFRPHGVGYAATTTTTTSNTTPTEAEDTVNKKWVPCLPV